jgi:hypothetical protein
LSVLAGTPERRAASLNEILSSAMTQRG